MRAASLLRRHAQPHVIASTGQMLNPYDAIPHLTRPAFYRIPGNLLSGERSKRGTTHMDELTRPILANRQAGRKAEA